MHFKHLVFLEFFRAYSKTSQIEISERK